MVLVTANNTEVEKIHGESFLQYIHNIELTFVVDTVHRSDKIFSRCIIALTAVRININIFR